MAYSVIFSPLFKQTTSMDKYLIAADTALRTLFAIPHAAQTSPAHAVQEAPLDPAQKRLAGA